ncbi:MAG: response regulator [Anaerolineae bacterium]|nr:response regulator [Anaerolineae bacterium]
MAQIMIVDPNVAFATLLQEELSRHGHGVTVVHTMEAALDIGAASLLDLAIVDMAVERPGPVALVKQLREKRPDLRIMLIPFMGEELTESVTISLSVQGVLPKPFFLPELPERIEAALLAPMPLAPAPDPVNTEPESEPEPEVEESATGDAPPAISEPAPPIVSRSPAEPSEVSRAVTAHRSQIQRVMNALALEVTADAVLLTVDDRLELWVGRLQPQEANAMGNAVIQGWHTSVEVARILGREQVRFEQSITGGDYMLYALSVGERMILAAAIRGGATLGLLRHRARGAAEDIAALCGFSVG